MDRIALALALLSWLPSSAHGQRTSTVSRLLTLKRAPIVHRDANGDRGTNETQIVSLAGPRGVVRAVWKPAASVDHTLFAPNVAPETYHLREVAATRVAPMFGVAAPLTVIRTIDGKEGSLMTLVEHAETSDKALPTGAQYDRARGERQTIFDYVIGNADRKEQNSMVKKRDVPLRRKVPIAIDNGMSFPTGALQWFKVRNEWIKDHDGPLLASSKTMLASLDGRRLARTLVKSGIDREAIVHTLRRLEALREHPELLERPANSGLAGAQAMEERLRTFGKNETQGLSAETLGAIDRVVTEAWGKRPKALDSPASFARYYATESLRLGHVIDHPADWKDHQSWAKTVGTPAATDELVRKIDLEVDRLAADRPTLARYYSQFAVRQLRQGTPFGFAARELPTAQPHYDWALTAPLADIKSEMAVRVKAIAGAFTP